MAAKKVGDLIPLCHPLALDAWGWISRLKPMACAATATASLTGKTGVEMEAMTATSDRAADHLRHGQGLDKAMVIEGIRLIAKSGGKSGLGALAGWP
jgi:cyclic pyranopterin phosphate synthase